MRRLSRAVWVRQPRPGALLLLFFALLGTGCASSPSASGPGERTRPHPATTLGPTTTLLPTTTTLTPASCSAVSGFVSLPNGRLMLVRSPATDHRRAAVIMVHGYTATTTGEEAVSGWTNLMAGTDVVVVYPQGSLTPAGGYGWSTGAGRDATTGTDDIGDLATVIAALDTSYCVAPSQILLAGESNGSGLGLEAACSSRLTGEVRLFALAIPAVDATVLGRCNGAGPAPLLVMASALDQTVPINGAGPAGDVPFLAPQTWFGQVATGVNRCTGLRSAAVPDATHVFYNRCQEPTNFFVALDGHHTWPGGPLGAGGLSPGVFPAAKVAWCASGLVATPTPVDCAVIDATYGITSAG